MVKINGEYEAVEGKTIAEYLEEAHFDLRRIAVERNGEIVPKLQYESTVMETEDVIEIVCFVGGG